MERFFAFIGAFVCMGFTLVVAGAFIRCLALSFMTWLADEDYDCWMDSREKR